MDTLASYAELEFPPPWTGLQGHAGGKDKSCEGPGPSLDSGFFKVNKRLLFTPKAPVCVDGGESPQLPFTEHRPVCSSQSPQVCPGKQSQWEGTENSWVQSMLQWMRFLKDLSSVSCAHVQWTRPASICRRVEHPWFPDLLIQHCTHLRTWPCVEIDWDLIVSNLYEIQ